VDIWDTIKQHCDHIIIGQGLAGACLAWQLTARGKTVAVWDLPEKNRASAVAAGLFNPIAGKRLTKSWQADLVFPYMFQFYRAAEKKLGRAFFHLGSLYRPFISVAEQNDWMARSEARELKAFVDEIFTRSKFGRQVHDDFGGISIRDAGYLNVGSFLQGVRAFLISSGAYREAYFDAADLRVEAGRVLYQDVEAKSVIFCQGISGHNHFFNGVPIVPLKGEILDIALEETPAVIFNRGIYIVPQQMGNGYRVGATYQPNDATEGVTPGARHELEEKLAGLIRMPYRTLRQDWGIRPSTHDRRPVMGRHPRYPEVLIFNGLGTKGVSLAPYFSGMLADWLEGKAEIGREVNIERFKALYSSLV